jgi:plasmid stabilization system protein ParE
MTFKIIFSNISVIDLEKIIEYYYNLNKETAKKYYYEIHDKIKMLKEFPEIGRIVPEFQDEFYNKYRELIYENYRIIYKIIEDEIHIVRIINGRRLLDSKTIE